MLAFFQRKIIARNYNTFCEGYILYVITSLVEFITLNIIYPILKNPSTPLLMTY